MKKAILMLATAAALFMIPSCEKVVGVGPVKTETRAISGFTGVSASISGKINYKIDPVFNVEITAQRNILDVIETSLTNGHLLIKVKNGVKIKSNENIVVNISAPTADYLHLSGSGDIKVSGNVITSNLDMNVSGSGEIDVASVVITDKINAIVSGSGEIKVQAGTAINEELRVSGSGEMRLDGVAAEKGICTISGSGNMRVNLSQTLDATISGSGSLYFRGSPQVTTHISGSGNIRPL